MLAGIGIDIDTAPSIQYATSDMLTLWPQEEALSRLQQPAVQVRFRSHKPRRYYPLHRRRNSWYLEGLVAQLVEHAVEARSVGGSKPPESTNA